MSNLIEILHRVSHKVTEVTQEVQIYKIMNEAVKGILSNTHFARTAFLSFEIPLIVDILHLN